MTDEKLDGLLNQALKADIVADELKIDESREASWKRTKKQARRKRTIAAAVLAVCLLAGGTAAYAAYPEILSYMNQQQTKKLGRMEVVNSEGIQNFAEGKSEMDYLTFRNELGVQILSETVTEAPEDIKVSIDTDRTNYLFAKMDPYFSYDGTPVAMEIDMILSEDQLATGLDKDYMGAYSYQGSFTTQNGDRVNLISDTTGAEHPELIAEMVSGGIKYILSGRVTIPGMKQIVESLEYVAGTEAEETRSSIYTDEDISAAEEIIRKEFDSWNGVKKLELRYMGDSCNTVENVQWMNDLNEGQKVSDEPFTQCIAFTSTFLTEDSAVPGEWNPDSAYAGWTWYLARTDGGEWHLMTWGY
ncbi:MAG: hypothetical protein VZQ80_08425 [Lachnospiraceae bacterium]|nr:hypothetical protein [Lachnospiraceae bacterium]